MSKYSFNQIVFGLTSIGLVISFYWLLTTPLGTLTYITLFATNVILLHYCLNLVHLASHGLLSKNRLFNSLLGNISAILGGLTLADFKQTHLLHHAFTSEVGKDPDLLIVGKGQFWLMPFKIWYHDKTFWSQRLDFKRKTWLGYLLDRFFQAIIVSGFFFAGHISVWIMFWLIPIYLVGFANGIYLFYVPHFSLLREKTLSPETSNQIKNPISRFWSKLDLFFIQIARLYHSKHHQSTSANTNYFPLEHYWLQKLTKKDIDR